MSAHPRIRRRFAGSARRGGGLALAASLGALAVALLGAAPAQAALPPQGLYEQCAPNSTTLDCGERLQTMADAGFKYVLNYTAWFGSAEEVRSSRIRPRPPGSR